MLTSVIEPRYRWSFADPVSPSPALRAAGARLGLAERVVDLLAARGLREPAELEAFFAAPRDGLHDPRRLPDADRLAERLTRARDRGERVMVFGDFDADGLTGLAILVRALGAFGVAVEPYVPSRLDEGHGLSLAAVGTAANNGLSVILTVDTGTTSVAEVAAAGARGIDVLVTDHHRPGPSLPPAVAVVNPHRLDASYPDRRLSGAGVAFAVARLLLAGSSEGTLAALELADLATIGTVADLAPVVGENRSIARLGLERIRTAPRPGIAALLARAGVAAATADLETVAYAIAPRLNAAGRMGEAIDAAHLLLADDPSEAERLAGRLEAANEARRELMKSTVAEVTALARTDRRPDGTAPATVVRGPWPVGIIGLVASRLAEETGRPAVVGAELGPSVRASCRSAGGMDLAAVLETCRDLFTRHGGHAGAAGFELPAERWGAFRERFLVLAAETAPADPRPVLAVDLALPGRAIDYRLVHDLARLGPTGPGHPEPLVAVAGLTVTRIRAASGGHTQLTLRRDPDVLDGIAFGRDDLAMTVHEGDRVDVVARIASRTFGGFESIQLEIRDVAAAGAHPETAAVLGALAR